MSFLNKDNKKAWRNLVRIPIPLEEVNANLKYEIIKKEYKSWRDFPHKRYDWVLTDDNWVVCVTWVFDDGSVSLAGQWILTPKKAKTKNGFRIFRFYTNRLRFNNRLKIFTNAAILFSMQLPVNEAWVRAYELAYNERPKTIKDMLYKFNQGVEDYMSQNLDKIMADVGVTDEFIVTRFKELSEGRFVIGVDENGVEEFQMDNRIRDGVMLEATKILARMRDIVVSEKPPIEIEKASYSYHLPESSTTSSSNLLKEAVQKHRDKNEDDEDNSE